LQVEALKNLSKILMKKETKEKLKKSKTKKNLIEVLNFRKEDKMKKRKKLVAITACPTGIAHTFLASGKIEEVAKKLGYDCKIETQGRTSENVLTKSEIENADIIIFAIDKGIEGLSRFNNKKVFKTSTKNVIKNAEKVISDAEQGKGEIIKAKSIDEEISSNDYS
jgi:PTS system fructose-specific IIC component